MKLEVVTDGLELKFKCYSDKLTSALASEPGLLRARKAFGRDRGPTVALAVAVWAIFDFCNFVIKLPAVMKIIETVLLPVLGESGVLHKR